MKGPKTKKPKKKKRRLTTPPASTQPATNAAVPTDLTFTINVSDINGINNSTIRRVG